MKVILFFLISMVNISYAQTFDTSNITSGQAINAQNIKNNLEILKTSVDASPKSCQMVVGSDTSNDRLSVTCPDNKHAMSGSANNLQKASLIGPCDAIGTGGACATTSKSEYIVEYIETVVNPRLYVLCCTNGR